MIAQIDILGALFRLDVHLFRCGLALGESVTKWNIRQLLLELPIP